ncbi:MAG: hypothetical protein M1421_06805, partial [Candidatus Eremiobacteraeota bacterium]|nr:hypothetical protein [Candidatus Eremiobacteraeota bacterium]
GNSVFEVIFNNGPNNNNNGYNLSDIAEDPTAPPSTPATFPTNEVSINNLAIGPGGPPPPPGGNSIPSYSARVIVLGYSHGVTRVVEAMFHDVGYVNSSVRSADGINIKAGCPTTAWNISSKDPYYNHIKAGISLQGSSFKQTGGWINGPTSLADTSFSQISGAGNMGNAYALECAYKTCNPSSTTTPILSNGQVSLDQIYPTSSTPPLTSVNTESTTSGTGNGTFYANSDHAGNLSSSSPVSASTMLSVISKEQTAPGPGGGPGSGGGATYYIPAGIWAIESDGKTVDVYSTTGTYLGQFKGSYKDKVNGNTLFSIQNFQIDLSPGYNFVVDNGITSAEVSTSPSSANPQGNLMVTLSPQDFTSSTGNETGGNSVLPTIGLGYNGYNTQGNSPSTLQVAGNLYVQGGIEGNGGVIVPTGASAPSNNNTSLSCSGCNWIPSNPSTTSYSYSQPDWSASWAASVITSSSTICPPL